jgi:hypothetical protein
VSTCPRCGWPEAETYEVLSRHLTSQGIVTYTRCACGEVQIRIQPYGVGESITRPARTG